MKAIDLAAELASAERYRDKWYEEKSKLDRTIAACAVAKTTPGPNYWEAERRAYVKYMLAAAMLEILLEETDV